MTKNSLNSAILATLIFLGITTNTQAHEAANATEEGQKLNAVITEYTEAAKRVDPFSAPYFNVEEDLDKFGDYLSPEFMARWKKTYFTALTQLKKIQVKKLQPQDLLTYQLFKEDMEVSIEQFNFPIELYGFNQMQNRFNDYLNDSDQGLTNFPFDNVKHYEAWIKRAEGFPHFVDIQISVLKRGIQERFALSCAVAEKARNTYTDGLESVVEKNPFFRPIGFMPKDIGSADRTRLTEGFKKIIADKIQPGFLKFDEFYRKEYLPHCRSGYGIGDLPRGKAWYAYNIRKNTNLSLPAAKIHAIGLGEVKRINTEMAAIRDQLGFKGTSKEFLQSLTQNPDYFFKKPEDLFHAFEAVKAKVQTKIPQYFSLIPKGDYKIVETSNPEDAAARYMQPSENAPTARFVVNTKNLRATPTYGVTTLSLHEAIPGHHFQLALLFEKKNELSEYQRKVFDSVAFTEGWALYSEYLGREMGMYEDPMQRLGNLNDEMLRAVRLVVDTGIHSKGWSQKQVLEYMSQNLANDPKDIENEANRYSVWPGQALGYKLGQLKIIELRRLAEKSLGKKFDIRDFHRVVIGNGTVSLGILESQVRSYIAATKNRPN